ncbi:fibronectin type III domain-containing protein [Sanguibacter massiliensis]|uniref:fibronectin type III domain-containing protein n=1 Tax=Sanguibacter massiliensis TaxID=1973217 RepID=UPI000C863478|nr:fibronectin type III domain-containing protein [Sanguibacter massiliensis]
MRTPRIVAGATAAALAIGLLTAMPAIATSGDVAAADITRTVTGETGDITLAWNAVRGATNYLVEIASDASFGSSVIVDKITTPALSWVPTTGLWGDTAERELFWRVTPQGVSSKEAPVARFTRAAAPAPGLISPADGATIAYPAPVEFTWAPVPGAVSYTLEYALEGSATWTSVPNLVTTSYTPAVTLRGDYTWRVSAHFITSSTDTALYQGPASPTRTFSSVWSEEDATPSGLSPKPGTYVNDVLLEWDSVPGASAYRVELSVDPKFSTLTMSSTVVGTVFAPVGLLPSVTYYWRVIPLDAAGIQANLPDPPAILSDEDLAKLPHVRKIMGEDATSLPASSTADTTKPTLRVGASAIADAPDIDFNDFALRWTPVPRATYYEIEVTQVNGTGGVTCQTASTSATIIAAYIPRGNASDYLKNAKDCLWTTDPGKAIRPGHLYRAKVRAVDMAASSTATYQGKSGSSADVVPSIWSSDTFFRIASPEPSSTTDFTSSVPQQQVITATSPELVWEPIAGATGYKVEIYADVSAAQEGSTEVAVFWTPTPSLRVNGVYRVNQAASSSDAFLAKITPAIADYAKTPSAGAPWPDIAGATPGKLMWKRLGETPPVGTVIAAGAQTLLSLTPTTAEQLGGANRGYVVEIREGNTVVSTIKTDQPATVALKSISGTNPVTMTALPKGNYTFRWAVLDAAGTEGPYSPAAAFTVGTSTIVNPAVGVLPGATSARLSWTGAVSASKFEVSVTPDGGTPVVVTRSSDNYRATSAVATGLIPGKGYSWSVVSIDKDNNRSEPNPGPSFIMPIGAVSTAPPAGEQDASRIVLDWEPVPGASRYLVRVAKAGMLTSTTPVETAATSYVPHINFAYGTSYVWDVRAVPAKADPLTSSTRPIVAASAEHPLEVRTSPAAPTGISATALGTDVTVSWNALSGAAVGSSATPVYTVEYRALPATDTTAWTTFTGSANATSLTITGLALATQYEFRVVASNVVGSSPYSTVAKVSTATYPDAPRSLRATPTADALTVSWAAPSATGGSVVSGYVVRYRVAGGSWVTATTATTSLKLTGLTAATPYEVEVAAVNAVGAGAVAVLTTSTSALPAQTPSPNPTTPATSTPPGAPTGLKAVRGDRKVTATWNAPVSDGGQPITGYLIETRQLSGKKWSAWSGKASTTGARSAVLTGLSNGTTYQVRVLAKTRLGSGSASTAVQFVPASRPLAPTIKVTSSKKKTVKVTWKAASANGSKVTGYRVQYSANGKKWKTLKTTNASARSYTWKKGKSKKPAYFRVQAKNALGWGTLSKATKVTVK